MYETMFFVTVFDYLLIDYGFILLMMMIVKAEMKLRGLGPRFLVLRQYFRYCSSIVGALELGFWKVFIKLFGTMILG